MNSVKVLAVMDITNDAMAAVGAPGSHIRAEARAAVAELIEASKAAERLLINPRRKTNSQWMTDQDRIRAESNARFRAAIARITGEPA